MEGKRGISSFSVLLLMAVTAIVGAAGFSMLKVQYTPSSPSREVSVSFSYPGASSRVVESEVTSLLEGVLSNIRGCRSVSSVSRNGEGSITLEFGRRTDLQSVRFEMASNIRNIYPSLPDGCSYPAISVGVSGQRAQTAVSFNILSSLPSKEIASFVEDRLIYPLSAVEGVADVSFNGYTPYEWVIEFDYDKASSLGITADDIASAFAARYGEQMLGMVSSGSSRYAVRLASLSEGDMGMTPVKNVGGRIVRLGDIASMRYQESLPSSYFRINGLNTLTLSVGVSPDANLLSVVDEVKSVIAGLEPSFPEEISVAVNYDSSEYIGTELHKIYVRTLLCLLLLLVFAFIANRSWRYMLLVAISLAVDILIAVCLYWIVGLEIHIYTLAGVTVSLGIIIDNTIVMVDHYSRHQDRSVFPALLSAVLTTVASLLAIFLLPESERTSLVEFSLAIVINLCVSLLVSYLFIPALLDYIPVRYDTSGTAYVRRLRRIVRWNSRYSSYLRWALSHRWVLALLLVASFGIPTCLLPEDISWKPYADNRKVIDNVLGTSFALFHKAMERSDFYREPERPCLTVSAGMPEGCTVQQLDEVMRSMENYLSSVDEIETFETEIYSATDGTIRVYFKPEVEGTALPSMIKGDVIVMAASFGGANWTVYGIDDRGFSNRVNTDFAYYGITLSGYNYDRLISYAETMIGHMRANRRVSDPEIWASGYDRPQSEFNVGYDFEALTAVGISPYEYYSSLYSPLYDASVGSIPYGGEYVGVRIESSAKDEMDLWHVENVAVQSGDGKMKLSEIGSIRKERTSLSINKEDQSYSVDVRYNFVGPEQMRRTFSEETVDWMNGSVLPLGYTAEGESGGWFYENQDKYAALILLVIAAIFVLCAVHFNSLRYPFSIILLIPVSFIGVFLVFGLSDFSFDKGGFAAFVMLSGITVNAGIYLVSAMLGERGFKDAAGGMLLPGMDSGRAMQLQLRAYIKAFNRKIIPISLTILSSIMGLVPFLFDGPSEVFWFDFAIGTITGLVFSVIALIFYLPAFALHRRPRRA